MHSFRSKEDVAIYGKYCIVLKLTEDITIQASILWCTDTQFMNAYNEQL